MKPSPTVPGSEPSVRSASAPLPASVEPLIDEVLLGSSGAWQAVVGAITPTISALARAHPSMRKKKLAHLEDDVAEVTTSTLERLARGDYKSLRRFVAQRAADHDRALTFESWLYGSVDFTVRDHLRKRYGRAPRIIDAASLQPSRRDLGTLAERAADEPLDRAFLNTLGATKRITAKQILAYVAARFEPLEVQALQLFYVEDRSLSEVATLLSLPDEGSAGKLIRRLNARLRYHFAPAANDDLK